MTERVYLHVGAPKSGTTYLQGVLREHADDLATQGVLVAGEHQVDLVHAAMVLRGDKRLAQLGPRAHEAWDRLVAQVRSWTGPVAIASYELFSNLSEDQARRALSDLDGLEVHVVITARDLGRSLTSAWQERLKFGIRQPLETWVPPAADVVDSEWGWRTLDPADVASRWGASLPPERLHVVTVPRGGSDPTELWLRFADACGIDGLVGEPATGRANESLDVVAAEVLRRANAHLGEFLRSPREKAVWSRDLLANRVLSTLGREPIAASEEQQRQARERYDGVRAAVAERGYRVHGDLADLEPSAAGGRTTGQVTDAEVAETAVRALAVLLREVRNDHADLVAAAQPDEDAELSRIRSLVSGTAGRRVAKRVRELHQRVDALEQALDDRRRLQQRLAMLTDLVAELLLPLEEADPEEQRRLIRTYRRTST